MTPLLRRLVGPGSPVRAGVAIVVDHVVVPLAGGPPPGLRRGRGTDRSATPVVLVAVVAADVPDVERALALVRQAQLARGGFTPVFVLEPAGWPLVRRAGYAVEHLPPGATGTAERLLELRRTYSTDAVLLLTGGRLDAVSAAHLLGAAQPRGQQRLVAALRALPRRLERWFDPGAR